MSQQYSFNPERRTFETDEKNCVYCKNQLSNGHETNYYQELFLEGKRLNLLVYRNVKYKSFFVCVPRCKKCKFFHTKSEASSNKWSGFLAIVLFIFVKFYMELSTFISIVIAAILFIIVQRQLLKDNLKKHEIPSESEGAKDVPFIQQYIDEGWQLEKPIA